MILYRCQATTVSLTEKQKWGVQDISMANKMEALTGQYEMCRLTVELIKKWSSFIKRLTFYTIL